MVLIVAQSYGEIHRLVKSQGLIYTPKKKKFCVFKYLTVYYMANDLDKAKKQP